MKTGATRTTRVTRTTRKKRSLPMGTYLTEISVIHRIDARVKLVLLFLITLTLFMRATSLALLGAFLLLCILVALAKVRASSVVGAIRPTLVILVFALISNAFVFDGSGTYALMGPLSLSLPGFVRGFRSVSRIIILLGLALVVSATTSSTELADAVVWFLDPLAHVGVPVEEFATIISLSLRLIPVCVTEFERIESAQRARAAHFDDGSMFERLKTWISVLVPLIVVLFSHADRLADAMRDRCYGQAVRTRLTKQMQAGDIVVLCCGCILCILVLVCT